MFWQKEEAPEYVEGKTDYTNRDLELMADEFLKKDSKNEMCRECSGRGIETGKVRPTPQFETDKKTPKLDDDGKQLVVDFPELKCNDGHKWYKGEGKARGIDGDNPILFEDHLRSRQKREIYTKDGTPDPSIKQGIYNRTHPQGRKVNTDEQRKKHGASWYRG